MLLKGLYLSEIDVEIIKISCQWNKNSYLKAGQESIKCFHCPSASSLPLSSASFTLTWTPQWQKYLLKYKDLHFSFWHHPCKSCISIPFSILNDPLLVPCMCSHLWVNFMFDANILFPYTKTRVGAEQTSQTVTRRYWAAPIGSS